MVVDLDKLNFFTGVNYMKRSEKSGDDLINAAQIVVNHDLEYVPQYAYYVDIDGDGFLWYGGERVFEGTESTAGGWTYPPIVDAWALENTLTFQPYNFTTNRAIYWLIYLDYGE